MVQTHEIGGHTSFVTRLATRGMTAHLSNDIMGYAAAKASVENYKQSKMM
jgi:hypothetical protein